MKRFSTISVFLTLSLILHSFLSASQSIVFRHTYGGYNEDNGRSVKQTNDGGYIIAGSTSSYGNGTSDIYLLRLDSLGKYKWSKPIGGSGVEWGNSVIQTADGGFAIAGYTDSFGAGQYDVYLVRTDSAGGVLWTKTFGGSDWDFGYSICPTPDGGFAIAGETYSFGSGNSDVFLIRTNSNGDILWTRTYGGIESDYARSVKLSFDNGFILSGATSSYGVGGKDAYLIRTNSSGDTLWTKVIGWAKDDWANDITETSADSSIVIVGGSRSKNSTQTQTIDYFYAKIKANGDTLWTRVLTTVNEDEVRQVIDVPSKGYVSIAYSMDLGAEDKEIYLIILTPAGLVLSVNQYSGLKFDDGFSIDETNDKGFVIAGTTNSYGIAYSDVLIIKTDSEGLTGSNSIVTSFPDPQMTNIVSEFSAGNNIVTYPNPATDKLYVSLPPSYISLSTQFSIYNITGQTVFSVKNPLAQFDVDIHHLTPGMYFYSLEQNSEIVDNGKMAVY